MTFVIHFYRRAIAKISSIIRTYYNQVVFKLYHKNPSSSLFEVALYLGQLTKFVANHKRLPLRPHTLFNDFLFQLASGPELGSALRTFVTDKELGKSYIEQVLGAGATSPTLCVLRTREQVDTYRPHAFPIVIKPTHSFGRVCVVSSRGDYEKAKPQIKNWLGHDYFLESMERNYAKLERKIIVEQYIDEAFAMEGSVHCFCGEPKVITLIDRKTKERQSFDTNKTPLGVSLQYPLKEFEPKGWEFLTDLLKNSRRLSKEFSYIRIDFYTDGERVLFGELTNLPAGGMGKFFPADGEKTFSRVFFSSSQK